MSTSDEGNKMTIRHTLRASLLTAALAFASCATTDSAEKKDGASAEGGDQVAENIKQGQAGDEKVTEFDLNKDKKPDVWTYTVVAKTADGKDYERVSRKDLDINWDGKVDIARQYDEKEVVSREALDLDFDGKVDEVIFYEKGVVVRKERNLTSAGRPSLWVFYEKGQLVRKEKDTNGDGKVDYWEYWENNQVDRVGEDLDGDGNVDKWTKNPDGET
jgi:antitoxin component YwqK of YwqJK toxin-antitoxin module